MMARAIQNFFVPERHEKVPFAIRTVRISAIIPTHRPQVLTRRLVKDLITENPTMRVYVVDDCTPQHYRAGAAILESIARISERVTVMRTPHNTQKAGALNFALRYIEAHEESQDVVLTLDDDVMLDGGAVRAIVEELMAHPKLGAVCSQCRVLNKNKNFLTRLQGLEYVGFNAIRLADEGFFNGPLVMPGMLTAFRARALREVGGFAEGHLIEDYEVTARLKRAGWHVKAASDASAWTLVPETFSALWRQRTRWSYGGIMVVLKARTIASVIQDLIGHGVFLATALVIGFLIFNTVEGRIPPVIAYWIISLSFVQLLLWYGFQLWLMRHYREKDIYDWLIRVSLLPEFLYSNITTLILLGSYFFLAFNVLKDTVGKHVRATAVIFRAGEALFRRVGYATTWVKR